MHPAANLSGTASGTVWRMDLVYPPVILTAKALLRGIDLTYQVVGAEHVPRVGGGVLASNHVSYLDFIHCGRAAHPSGRLVRFMAKQSVFDHPASGLLMRSMHHIPVDRSAGASAFTAAVQALGAGEVVGVFPEATISQAFEPKAFKTGAARMAAQANVPLIPMVTFGGQRLWTKGRKREIHRHVCVSLTVGEPFHPTLDEDPVAVTADLRERIIGLFERTIEAYPQAPSDQAWWWPARYGGGAPTLAEVASWGAGRTAG